MKNKFVRRFPGFLVTGLLFLAMIMFLIILASTKILPAKFLLIAGGIFLLITLCVFFLTRDARKPQLLIFGCVVTLVVLILELVTTGYLVRGVNTLGGITTVDGEIAEVGVYVRTDDPAQNLSDLNEHRFGILTELDRENTDKTISLIKQQLHAGLVLTEYEGLTALVDSLITNDETDVIILNSAYLELLRDMDGYADAVGQLRQLHVEKVETAPVLPTPSNNGGFWESLFGPGKDDPEQPVATQNQPFVMYISGIDTRGSISAKSRSDVNILAVVNPNTHQVLLLSTPRDYYVPLSISNGIPDKLTHAGIYGIDVSMDTLEMLYDVPIDYYFRVNFNGFEDIVDALGGITVHSDIAFTSSVYSSPDATYYFQQGQNTLNGTAALVFARERYAFADGDRQRGENQMKVIRGVIEKAMSPALLTNYVSIMDSVSGSFETSMPYDKIAELVRNQLDDGGSWNISSYSVSGRDELRVPYSLSFEVYVMIPDESTVQTAREKIDQVLSGQMLQP